MDAGGLDPELVTEEERNGVLSALVRATSEGQLTLEEFGRRTDIVLTTGSREELQAATTGLAVPPSGRVKRHWFVPFGNRIVRGHFALAPRTGMVVLMGEVHLDLRGAVLLDHQPVIRLTALLGNLRILVPAGIQVEVDESGLFGGRQITTYGPSPGAARPSLRVRMVGLLGSVKVTDDPARWSPALTQRA